MACDAGLKAMQVAVTDSETHFLRVLPWGLHDNESEVIVNTEETIALINKLRRGPIRVQWVQLSRENQ